MQHTMCCGVLRTYVDDEIAKHIGLADPDAGMHDLVTDSGRHPRLHFGRRVFGRFIDRGREALGQGHQAGGFMRQRYHRIGIGRS